MSDQRVSHKQLHRLGVCKCATYQTGQAGEQPHAKTFVPSVTTNSSAEPSKPKHHPECEYQPKDAECDGIDCNMNCGEPSKPGLGERQMGTCRAISHGF